MTETPRNIYESALQAAQQKLKKVSARVYALGTAKLLIFIAFIGGIIYFWGNEWHVLAATIVTLVPFFILLKWQNRLISQTDYLKKKVLVNEQEINALNGDFSAFEEGAEYIDESHYYTYDIDVFGNGSLFQAINRTCTLLGKAELAGWLNQHLTDKCAIEARQAAVRELSTQTKFRQHFRILGLLHEGKTADKAELLAWASGESRLLQRRWLRWLPMAVLAVNIVLFGCALAQLLPWFVAVNVWAVLGMSSFVFSGKITKLQTVYDKKLQILSTYAALIRQIEKAAWQSDDLQRVQQLVSGHDQRTASEAIAQLSKQLNALNNRGNLLLTFVRNGLYYWELKQMMGIERWRAQYAKALPAWLDAIAETDALCSLATFAFNHSDYTFPVIAAKPFRLVGEEVGHPLIADTVCVKNPVSIEGKPHFLVVTGANMAGKSTYLRTVSVNYLLACVGAPVCAKRFEVYPAQLISSLRTSDSLRSGESYFFAELKRLKLIIDLLKDGRELFVVLDEILRGTNSRDKQKGSYAFVRQLMQLQTDGIIATHDLQLAALADVFPDEIGNFCFEADIVDNELHFSYHLREGVAKNMNACFLMQKMGIEVE